MTEKLTSEKLNQYLWESLVDFKEGDMTANELKAICNAADKIIKVSLLDVMSKNAIGNNPEIKELN